MEKMNYSLIKKSISKLPDDVDEAPFKIINRSIFFIHMIMKKSSNVLILKQAK